MLAPDLIHFLDLVSKVFITKLLPDSDKLTSDGKFLTLYEIILLLIWMFSILRYLEQSLNFIELVVERPKLDCMFRLEVLLE